MSTLENLSQNQSLRFNVAREILSGLFRPDGFQDISQITDSGEEYRVYSYVYRPLVIDGGEGYSFYGGEKIRCLEIIYKTASFREEEMLVERLEKELKSNFKLFRRRKPPYLSLAEVLEVQLQAGFLARRIITARDSGKPSSYYKINLELENDYFSLTRCNLGETWLTQEVEQMAKNRHIEDMNGAEFAMIIPLMEGAVRALQG